MPDAVFLRLAHIVVDIRPKTRNRRLRQVEKERRERGAGEREERAHAPRRRLVLHAAAECAVRAVKEIPEDAEARENEERRSRADIRLDEVDALAPVREVERHERGGREAVPDHAVVGDLRERDQQAKEVEKREQSRDDPLMPDAKERRRERGEEDDLRRADDEVGADLRHIPVLMIRPCIEERERHAPREPRQEIRQHGRGKERHARRVRQKREREDDGHERCHEIARAHILPDIDIEGNETDEVRARCRQPAYDVVLARCGNRHKIPRFDTE